MGQKSWQILKKGDLVDIVAPGMAPDPRVLSRVVPFLESWGLKVRIADDLIGNDLLSANSLEYRIKSLKTALRSKESKMVWCLRGGYGSIQLLPSLKKMKAPAPKLLMGLSDITSLHIFLNQQWGWSSVHGSHLDRFLMNNAKKAEVNRFRKFLFGELSEQSLSIRALNTSASKKMSISAPVLGGNMVTLQSGIGTDFQLKTRGKVLFLEDIGERAYRVDRILQHLSQAGMLAGLKGIVFGQFTGGKEPGGKPSKVDKLLKQFAAEQKFPVFAGLSCGHGPNQYPLPLNTKAKLIGGPKAKLIVTSGAKK